MLKTSLKSIRFFVLLFLEALVYVEKKMKTTVDDFSTHLCGFQMAPLLVTNLQFSLTMYFWLCFQLVIVSTKIS